MSVTLILASTSPIRRAMLDAAGIEHRRRSRRGSTKPRSRRRHDDPARDRAGAGRGQGRGGQRRAPDDWVIGSDSVVSVDGRLFDKPRDRDEAADHLRFFSGQTMVLTSAVALARDGTVDWSHADQARSQVRDLSDAFIADYLDAEWPEVGYCVGVFRMEGRGVQLFDSIDGRPFHHPRHAAAAAARRACASAG